MVVAGSRFSFFALPNELCLAMRLPSRKYELRFFNVVQSRGADLVEISEVKECLEDVDHSKIIRALHAADCPPGAGVISNRRLFTSVSLEMPKLRGSTLFLGAISAKDDWYENKKVTIMPEGVDLLGSIRKELKIWTHAIVSAREPGGTGREVVYRSIKATMGALKHCEAGGVLRQIGVGNVEFLIRRP